MADPSTCLPLTRASVQAAHELIKPYIHKTPTLTNKTLNKLASTPRDLKGTRWSSKHTPANPKIRLFFKCENFQRVGAFKARGAFHAIERLKQAPGWVESGGKEKGVVTHSSGNHAQALSLAASENGIKAYIVMPTISAAPKIAATRGYGAEVIFSGSTSVEREAVTEEVMQRTGARLVPPYDHPDIILGQGTLGLELQEQVREIAGQKGLDAVIAPCGGGGMLSGVALSAEGTGIKVFGAEPDAESGNPDGADDATRGYYAGKRVEKVSSLTIADGLRTPVGVYPWDIIYTRKLVSGMYSVTEEEIKDALRLVYERMKILIEPSSAVGLAVALYNEDFREMVEREAGEEGWDVGVVVTGGNVDLMALGGLFGGMDLKEKAKGDPVGE